MPIPHHAELTAVGRYSSEPSLHVSPRNANRTLFAKRLAHSASIRNWEAWARHKLELLIISLLRSERDRRALVGRNQCRTRKTPSATAWKRRVMAQLCTPHRGCQYVTFFTKSRPKSPSERPAPDLPQPYRIHQFPSQLRPRLELGPQLPVRQMPPHRLQPLNHRDQRRIHRSRIRRQNIVPHIKLA